MAGLLGLGGIGGLGVSGATPPAGLLGPYYNPADMKRQQIKQGLLSAGISMLTNGKGSTGEVIGQALGGGLTGAMNAGINYKNDVMGYNKMAQDMEEQAEKRKQKAAIMEFVSKLSPEDQKLAEAYPEMFAKAYLEQKTGGKGDEYGLNPVWTQDAEGKWHLYQPSKGGGQPRKMDFGGNIPQPNQTYLNLGTQFMQAPSKGALPQAPATVPIDNAGEAAAKKVGADQGEAAALHASLSSKLPGLKKVVSDLEVLADQATYTKAGQLYNLGRKELGLEPTESAVARAKYIAMVDNQVLPMLRDTFGAQFTVVEGESLRATLGDPNKTPEEKKAVLNAFIEQKIRNIEASAVQGGVAPAPAQNQAPRLRFNPQTGDFE